jgi:RNA recognition motif-containing protein
VNIYVGNIPKNATEDSVRKLFETYGQVSSVKLVEDRYTGELRGFGFVEMPSKEEGQAAIEGANGTELDGKSLIVNEARPKTTQSGGRRGGGSGGGGGFQGKRSRSW